MDCTLGPLRAGSLTAMNVLGCSFSSPVGIQALRALTKSGPSQAAPKCHGALLAQASLGRVSGAVHGSNARKSRWRRHEDESEQDGNENNPKNETIRHEHIEGQGLSDDDSDDKGCASKAEYNRERVDMDMYVYDHIHGDFWPNDPYFKEMEASQREKRGEEPLDKSRTGVASSGEKPSNVPLRVDNGKPNSGGGKRKQTDGNVEKGAISSADARMANLGILDVKHGKQKFERDNQRSLIRQMDRRKDILNVRVTESSERPADFSGSLESLCSNDTDMQFFRRVELHSPDLQALRNTELDPTDLEDSSDNKRGSFGTRECGNFASIDKSDIAADDLCIAEEIPLQNQSISEGGKLEHQVVDLERLPPESSVKLDERSDIFSSTEVVGQFEKSVAQVLTVKGVGPLLQLENQVSEMIVQVDDISTPVVEQVGQVVEQVAQLIPEPLKEQVVQMVDHVERLPTHVSQAAEQVVAKVVDQMTEVLPDPVVDQVSQVAEQVSYAAEQIVEQVTSHFVDPITTTASQITNLLSSDEDDDESDDEFEAYRSSESPEFKGIQGLNNFIIMQEDQGVLSIIYDSYIYMLKKPLPEFVLAMFAAPILLSVMFTILYLPEFSGLALDETAREFYENSQMNTEGGPLRLQLSWQTLFHVFMFSVSLSTGLQPELAPLSPYTLVVANINALIAQLIFVFLSGAVFARISQPSQPVRCSTVALVSPPPIGRRLRKEACHKVLLTRYVLVGPQPSELVDVKVDLTYKYNTVTRSGTYFRTTQSLKLMYHGVAQVRPEIAYLNHGMLVRHVIDETSPLYERPREKLEKEDAVFTLSVVGLERSSMQSVFHVQHYCVYDGDVVWDAEFEDMILISKKNRRVVDHSLLSKWRPVNSK